MTADTLESQPVKTAGALKTRTQALKVAPLQRNYSLDALYKHWKVQPHIGSEFDKGVQIRDILNAENSDALLQDLAVLVSERNVVFLRNQDVAFEEQKEFVDRLGKAGGKPASSGLHKHPVSESSSEFGQEAYVISSELDKRNSAYNTASELHSTQWHSDVTFEGAPSDYAALKLRVAPPEGGDTLWASAYEIYERFDCYSYWGWVPCLNRLGLVNLNSGPRGSPENVGVHLSAVHPVIRTNPVTGWKGVFANKIFTKRINELSKDESDLVLAHLFNLGTQNHDLQVRFKWGVNDVAIWDNRSAFHTATLDFDFDAFERLGERATSVGERPYLDPASTSRREALGIAPPPSRRAHLASLGAGVKN
ncbi:hypothetical protein HDU77_002884 [Chytriomyces hyalinus]|nr:hypothetical protein HDU77_002884 [Chytriomyces hyalinus]